MFPKYSTRSILAYAEALESLSGKNPVNTLRIVAPNAKSIDLGFKEKGSVIKRELFDTFLMDLVSGLPNVSVFEDTAISAIDVSAESVRCRTTKNLTLQSRIIIGCDGAQGIVNRWHQGNSKIDRKFYAGGVRAYFKGVKGHIRSPD